MKNGLILFALAGASLLGCGGAAMTPAQTARADRFKCEAHAFEKVLPSGMDALEIVEKLYVGGASLQSILENLDITPAELQQLGADIKACRAGSVNGDGKVVTPPPATVS